MTKDKVGVDYREALHIEKIRNQFFVQLKELLQDRHLESGRHQEADVHLCPRSL